MESFHEAIARGFEWDEEYNYFKKSFGDGFELTFEPLLFQDQFYVALYQDGILVMPKVCVRPGKV